MDGLECPQDRRRRTGTREAQHGKDEDGDDWSEPDETGDSVRGIASGPSSMDVRALKPTREDGVSLTTQATACADAASLAPADRDLVRAKPLVDRGFVNPHPNPGTMHQQPRPRDHRAVVDAQVSRRHEHPRAAIGGHPADHLLKAPVS